MALSFNQGSTTIKFFAADSAGNVSEPAEISIFVNSIAPDLNFNIIECGNSLTAGCLSTSTTATMQWSSAAGDLANYELNCETGGLSCAGFPKTFAATSSAQITEILNDFTFYTFTLKAGDVAGNQTEISRTIETASIPVVINEVGWMGTDSSSNDEWIELKNNTSQAIMFTNWVLRSDDNTPYILLGGSISAGGYFILERRDDNTISDVAANLTYGNDGTNWALHNSGERLLLERINGGATSTIDEVSKCGSNWCAGNNDTKKTMERVDSKIAGTVANNWVTALGEFILNGADASGGPILGTPKAKIAQVFL